MEMYILIFWVVPMNFQIENGMGYYAIELLKIFVRITWSIVRNTSAIFVDGFLHLYANNTLPYWTLCEFYQ